MRLTAAGCAAQSGDVSWAFSLEAFIVARTARMTRRWPPAGTLPCCMPACNRSHVRDCAPGRVARRAEPLPASMSRNGPTRRVEDRLGERKLQHDLAVIVGNLDGGAEQRAFGAVGLQQFADHRARHFPGAIRVAKHFAIG